MYAPKKSKLPLIIMLVLGVVVLVGLSQYRRKVILQRVAEIQMLGGQVEISQSLVDYLWQRTPSRGYLNPIPGEVNPDAALVEVKMKALGIKQIRKRRPNPQGSALE